MTRRHLAMRTVSSPRVAVALVAVALSMASVFPALANDDQALVAAPAGTVVETVHAVGAQIYDCKADGHGGFAWTFREPIASLIDGGKTVGRHFAGPAWEMLDGSLVVGKVVGKAPGTAGGDIPWLKLDVSQHRGTGILQDVTTVQRIHTVGGAKAGPCPAEGVMVAEPYLADYVFSRP